MFKKRKWTFFPIIATLVLVGLFAVYTPVQAEGDAPPEQPLTEETAVPGTESESSIDPAVGTSVEAEAGSESSTKEVPAAAEATPEPAAETAVTETPADESEALPAVDGETPDTIPTETAPQLVVVDEDGEALPLASEEAGEALTAPDPYFFITGIQKSFTSTDCDPDTDGNQGCSDPIDAAFEYIAVRGLSPDGGAIYVEAAPYSENVLISSSEWADPTKIPAALSLIGAGSDSTFLTGSLTVIGLKSFTLQGFSITGTIADGSVVTFINNTGTINLIDVDVENNGAGGSGLAISNHSGPVNLNMVDASDNGDIGASIENTVGTAAAITIKNSSFDDNTGEGLDIISNGLVTITGITANRNKGLSGALINSRGLTLSQSDFSGNTGHGLQVGQNALGGNVSIQSSQFSSNTLSGAYIEALGNVVVSNIRSSNNGAYGLFVDTCILSPCTNPFTGSVTISQSNFTGNAASVADTNGITVLAKGIVTLTDVYSGGNGDITHVANGAILENNLASAVFAVNVTSSSFVLNSGHGLLVFSKGIITIKDSTATSNSDDGIYLDNQISGVTSGVNILNTAGNTNTFSSNASFGIEVFSNGVVVINAVQANDNGMTGIYVENPTGVAAVTIDGVSGTTASRNDQDGIQVISKGVVTIRNMDATNNVGNGFNLNNLAGAAGVNVLATLPRWVNNLDDNGLDGLHILSRGAILIQKTSANNNQHYGAYIANNTGSGAVTITDSTFNENAKVNVSPSSPEVGLFISSGGNIVLTNVTASFNGVDGATDVIGYGAYLDNGSVTAARTVTITNGNFNNNFGDGLQIHSTGAVTFKTGSVSNNNTAGAFINNTYHLTTPAAVTISAVTITANTGDGLTVNSKGNIGISATDVYANLSDGTVIDNHLGSGTVTISGTAAQLRNFGNNTGAGLTITSKGAVTVSYLTINENGSYGAQVDNTGATSAVTFTSVEFNNNGTYGLDVNALGSIAINNSPITNNLSYGAILDNSGGTGSVAVKSTTVHAISNNTTHGLQVLSKRGITITNMEVHDNGTFGALLDNCRLGSDPEVCTGTGSVTITNSAIRNWRFNEGTGLEIRSAGAVSINLVDLSSSNGTNLTVNNLPLTGTAIPGVTISNSLFNTSQAGSGIEVTSNGNIVLTNVHADGNTAGPGALLNNGGTDGKGSVTISGVSTTNRSTFNNNSTYGFQIFSKGAVSVKYVTANDNQNYGGNIDNSNNALSAPVVTITLAEFNGNAITTSAYGLRVYSKGAITATDILSANNGDADTAADGIILDNCRLDGDDLCTGAGAVTLTNVDSTNNYGDGISVDSYGAITLLDVNASDNHANGAAFDNSTSRTNPTIGLDPIPSAAKVSLALPAGYSLTNNAFNNNTGYGLSITSNGAITVANVNVIGNDAADYAAYIDNSDSPSLISPAVSVIRGKFNLNEAVSGIQVFSKGAITFSNNDVTGNTGVFGADQSAVELDNESATGAQNVTVTSSTINSNTGGSGLSVNTRGSVVVTNVSSIGNAAEGIKIDATSGIGTVTFSGTRNVTIGNGLEVTSPGVSILSNGNVSITGLTSDLNSGNGLFVNTDEYGRTAAGNLTIINSNFSRNGVHGIEAVTNGTITITGVTSLRNGIGSDGDGAHLTTNAKDITITNSSFMGNEGSGIESITGAAILRLVNISYFGNDIDRDGDANLIYSGPLGRR